jgi:hypothetical protein
MRLEKYISIQRIGSLTMIEFDSKRQGMYTFMKDKYFEVLTELFINQPVTILLVKPDKKSFLMQKKQVRLILNRPKIYVNSELAGTPQVLEEIAESIEFETGSLFIMKSDEKDEQLEISSILETIRYIPVNNELFHTDRQLVFTESDGYRLTLLNSSLSPEAIDKIIHKNNEA